MFDNLWLRRALTGMALVILQGCAHPHSIDRDGDVIPALRAPNDQHVVSVHWLKRALEFQQSKDPRQRPATYENDRLVILEASWATLEKAGRYRAGHVPGAIHLNTDDFENGSPRWHLRSGAELQRVIGATGITPETTVIVYGDQLIAAARVWWVLKYGGVTDVRLLDGGFEAWEAAGYPVEMKIRVPKPEKFVAPLVPELVATSGHVRDRLERGDVWLADVRSKEEFLGESSGYSYLDAKGRIPGATHLGDADDSAFLYRQRNGRLRAPSEILTLWSEHGIVPQGGDRSNRELIFYCGGGWRSSLAFFYATLIGFENVRNYVDGWSGWSTVYLPDDGAKGITPGWRQQATGNPVEFGTQ